MGCSPSKADVQVIPTNHRISRNTSQSVNRQAVQTVINYAYPQPVYIAPNPQPRHQPPAPTPAPKPQQNGFQQLPKQDHQRWVHSGQQNKQEPGLQAAPQSKPQPELQAATQKKQETGLRETSPLPIQKQQDDAQSKVHGPKDVPEEIAQSAPLATEEPGLKSTLVSIQEQQADNLNSDEVTFLLPKTFVEFPTHQLLREANQNYADARLALKKSKDGQILPYPTPTTKQTMFHLEKFEEIDRFAINVDASHYTKTVQDFTTYLIQHCKGDELAISRVIFRWLAAQDVDKYLSRTPDNSEVIEWYLHHLKESPGYYTQLYRDMCMYAGLQAETIRGYAKHAKVEPGEDIKPEDINTWIGVLVNNEWRIVDPHWGSSHMVGSDPGEYVLLDDNGEGMRDIKKELKGTAYEYNEVYFLTNPEQYIYSHLPENEAWQFLARPVTTREFTEMAYLKPAFFDLGLSLLEHRKCIIHASEGEIDIRLATPNGQPRSFMYRLWISNEQSVDDIKLERFVIMQQKNGILSCRIFFPKAGKYKLELYGRRNNQTIEDTACYKMACAYIIHSEKAAEGVKSFPENKRHEWGPGLDLEAAGLHPITHDDAMIEAEDGTTCVRFKMDRPVEVLTQLHSNNKSKEQLEGHVLHYKDEKNSELVVKLRLPESDDYALNLFAKDEGTTGSLLNVCSYIVSCESGASDPRPYPKLTNGRLGSTIGNRLTQLKLTSHEGPIIDCPESGRLELAFSASVPCDTTTELELCTKEGNVQKEDYVWTLHDKETIKYQINFPEPGVYVFKVYAKEADAEGSYPHAYTCLINVPIPRKDCVPYPKSFASWTPDCRLLSPTMSVLPANSKVNFELELPHAYEVTSIASSGWCALRKENDGIWRGEVDTPAAGETLKVSATVEEGSTSFSTLLTYKVEEQGDMKEEEKKQQRLQEEAIKQNEAKKLKEEQQHKKRQKEFENAEAALSKAIKARNLAALRKAVKNVELKKFANRLEEKLARGRQLIKSLERIRKLQQAVLNMDQKTMLEIKNYASPPVLVREVMIATLLILGDSESKTREWSDCQKRLGTIGKDGLPRRVDSFDVTTLHPEIAARALQLVGHYRLDDVRDVSTGAGTFYAWTVGMIEELRITSIDAHKAEPAKAARQKEIFRVKSGRG